VRIARRLYPGAAAGRASRHPVAVALYDSIGRTYTRFRGEEPRLAARIHAALGDARTVVNVGAGAGAYEPRDRDVLAIEPSEVMIAQRPPDAVRAIRASAEALPLADGEVDAAMSVLSDHHWPDRAKGLREMRRVARRRAVVFQFEPSEFERSWLVRDYLHAFEPDSFGVAEIAEHLGATRIEPVPIPHDCRDGFMHAYWRRPHAYLDPAVREAISVFQLLPAERIEAAMQRLRADLDSGAWHRRNAEILELDELDLGYRLIVAEYG
jgi:SAM-dependent methyltransferase